MQPYAMPAPGNDGLVAHQLMSTSLVIVTDVDGTLRDPGTFSCDPARDALATLADQNVPVVVVAEQVPDEVMALQRELGLRAPFIAEGGAALYVPRGYFPEFPTLGEPVGPWDVIRFDAYDSSQAVRLLISLYRACSAAGVVIVGLGDEPTDRAWLSEVDVPVIVRNDAVDQARLIRKLPAAYRTSASGAAGWSEAILGSVGE